MDVTRRVPALLVAALLLAVTACGGGQSDPSRRTPAGDPTAASAPSAPVTKLNQVAVDKPAALEDPLLSSDILVLSKDTLDEDMVKEVGALKGVTHTETFTIGQFFAEETGVTYAAVDPATFRRLTPPGTAQTLDVWTRVAGGEVAVSPGVAKKIADKDGYIKIGAGEKAQRIHIGAYAQLTAPEINPATRIDAVVNKKWVGPLQMKPDNAMILSMGSRSPQSLLKELRAITGKDISVQILGPDLDPSVVQIAIPTGGSVASAIGSFGYTVRGGQVIPEAGWVRANIRSEVLPLVGRVTCHKAMIAQLRMVMLEAQRLRMSKAIYDYGGCYVPRYIAGKSTLSNHSFGTAIDLNVQDNLRGVPGKMDRGLVAIFKRWGFAWGGDWSYTDPMHFELARIVKTG